MQIQVRLLGDNSVHHPVPYMSKPSANGGTTHSFLSHHLAKQDIPDHATFLNYFLPSACFGTQTSPSVPGVEDN